MLSNSEQLNMVHTSKHSKANTFVKGYEDCSLHCAEELGGDPELEAAAAAERKAKEEAAGGANQEEEEEELGFKDVDELARKQRTLSKRGIVFDAKADLSKVRCIYCFKGQVPASFWVQQKHKVMVHSVDIQKESGFVTTVPAREF